MKPQALPIKEIERYIKDKTKNPVLISHDFGHLKRVARGAEWFAGVLGASEKEKRLAYVAGLIHDLSRPATEKKDHTKTSVEEAKKVLEKFGFEDSDKNVVLEMVEMHRLGSGKRIFRCVFLADKILEQMGAYVAFRRSLFVAEIKDYKNVSFKEGIMHQFRARLDKFPPKAFSGKFMRLAERQYEWSTDFFRALSKNMAWALSIAENFYSAGKSRRKTLEELIEDYRPVSEEDGRYKQEALDYINGKKFKDFGQMVESENEVNRIREADRHMKELTVPGKILFYGGFSVLEKGNISLSIAAADENKRGVSAKYETGERRIISPQFGIDMEPSLETKQLIAYPYIVAEAYLKAKGLWKNDVKVEVRNSRIFGNKEEKTGLGSSAAATVAVVKALFEANGIDSAKNAEIIHKLSQFSYALFSQKVGSGFDIATSAFGRTIVYYRYNPQEILLPKAADSEGLSKAILESVEKPWGWIKATPFSFPSKYRILFFNIRGGKTSTISSVKALMQWKANHPTRYGEIIKTQKEAEEKAIDALSRGIDNDIREHTHKARDAHRLLQTETAGIVSDFDPIEPEPLTRIIEESEKFKGVIAGRCPGAGGWDGLAFIAKKGFKDTEKIIEIGKKEGLKLEYIPLMVL